MRGALRGEENARRLRTYLAALAAEGRGLPSRDGKPNLSVIAAACGFDRGVFYANQEVKLLLDEATRNLGLDVCVSSPPRTAFEEVRIQEERKAPVEARSRALEEELLRVRAENARLRVENERLCAIRTLMAETGRVP